MRALNRLSAQAVARAKPADRVTLLHDGAGLYLRVTPSGARSWVLRYQQKGKRHELGLGAYPLFSLADARQRATEMRRQVATGHDPRRRARLNAVTLEEAAERYIDSHKAGWRSGSRSEEQWRNTLALYVYPAIGRVPIADVTTAHVLQVLSPIWTGKNESASRIRGRLESILDYAVTLGLRESGANPAQWRGNLRHALPSPKRVQQEQTHLAAMPYGDLPAFVARLRSINRVDAYALQFLILCASRAGEVRGATWGEINRDVWAIPGPRMKGGKEHRVPLSDAAQAVLATVAELRVNDFVFLGSHGMMHRQAMREVLQRLNCGHYTVHGFRSTFRDWCAEQTPYPREVAEIALAHRVGDATERAYARSDLFERRRQLMQQWADYCAGRGAADQRQAAN